MPQYPVHKAADHRRQTKASGQSLLSSPTPAGPRFSPAAAPDQRGGHSSLSHSGVTYAPERPPSTMNVDAVT